VATAIVAPGHVVHRLGRFPRVAGVRPLNAGDQHRCDLAFADNALLTGQYFAGDVCGGIGAGRSRTDIEGDRHVSGHSAAAAAAEAFGHVVAKSTVQAWLPQRLATRSTELPRRTIGRLTLRTRQGSGRGGVAHCQQPYRGDGRGLFRESAGAGGWGWLLLASRQCGGRSWQGADHRDEAVAITPQRFDHLLLASVVRHCPANHLHAPSECRVRDKLPGPARGEQFLLGDSPIPMRQQIRQHREGFGL
jgi:hypothetical protein